MSQIFAQLADAAWVLQRREEDLATVEDGHAGIVMGRPTSGAEKFRVSVKNVLSVTRRAHPLGDEFLGEAKIRVGRNGRAIRSAAENLPAILGADIKRAAGFILEAKGQGDVLAGEAGAQADAGETLFKRAGFGGVRVFVRDFAPLLHEASLEVGGLADRFKVFQRGEVMAEPAAVGFVKNGRGKQKLVDSVEIDRRTGLGQLGEGAGVMALKEGGRRLSER